MPHWSARSPLSPQHGIVPAVACGPRTRSDSTYREEVDVSRRLRNDYRLVQILKAPNEANLSTG